MWNAKHTWTFEEQVDISTNKKHIWRTYTFQGSVQYFKINDLMLGFFCSKHRVIPNIECSFFIGGCCIKFCWTNGWFPLEHYFTHALRSVCIFNFIDLIFPLLVFVLRLLLQVRGVSGFSNVFISCQTTRIFCFCWLFQMIYDIS